MSLYRLSRILVVGGVVDAVSPSVRYTGILRSGQLLALVGGVLIVARFFVHDDAAAFIVFGAVLSFLVAGLLLLFFALGAKLYGQVAVAFVLLFIAGCFGLVTLGTGPSQPVAELTERSTAPRRQPSVPTEPGSDGSGLPEPSLASEAVTQSQPRAETIKAALTEPLVAQVYAVNETHLYYSEGCSARPKNAFRIPKTIAVQQGYALAKECIAQ